MGDKMNKKRIRIASRKSPMAMWQAEFVKEKLLASDPNLCVEIIGLTTQGDQNTQQALSSVGGKDLFIKELQRALLAHEADIAVHCIKDMSVHAHDSLVLDVVCEREDPRDVLVSNQYKSLAALPDNAVVGTASPRREALLLHYFPHLKVKLIRGNVNTRLSQLDEGAFDAIILAAAGLHRLSMQERIREYLDLNQFVPAIAQGALGIECREDDGDTREAVSFLNHAESRTCIDAERAVNKVLGGNCYAPIGAYAHVDKGHLKLSAIVLDVKGKTQLKESIEGIVAKPESLGETVGQRLQEQGANDLWNN